MNWVSPGARVTTRKVLTWKGRFSIFTGTSTPSARPNSVVDRRIAWLAFGASGAAVSSKVTAFLPASMFATLQASLAGAPSTRNSTGPLIALPLDLDVHLLVGAGLHEDLVHGSEGRQAQFGDIHRQRAGGLLFAGLDVHRQLGGQRRIAQGRRGFHLDLPADWPSAMSAVLTVTPAGAPSTRTWIGPAFSLRVTCRATVARVPASNVSGFNSAS